MGAGMCSTIATRTAACSAVKAWWNRLKFCRTGVSRRWKSQQADRAALPCRLSNCVNFPQPPQVNAEAGQNPFPYITQDGADVMPESESKPEAYICNLTPGTVVGFKYLNFQNVTKVSVKTRGMCYYGGFDVLLTADGEPIGTVSAARGNEWTWQTTELAIPNGISAIYFRMKGYGTLSLAAAKFH